MTRMRESIGAREVDGLVVLDSERHIPYFFTYISNKLSYGAGSLYRELFDIGITEWRIMSVLAAQPNIGAHQICAFLGMDKAVVSRSLHRLEELKLVKTAQRKPNKALPLSLSKFGLSQHNKIIQIALERERRLLSALTQNEKKSLLVIMKKLKMSVDDVNKWRPDCT